MTFRNLWARESGLSIILWLMVGDRNHIEEKKKLERGRDLKALMGEETRDEAETKPKRVTPNARVLRWTGRIGSSKVLKANHLSPAPEEIAPIVRRIMGVVIRESESDTY